NYGIIIMGDFNIDVATETNSSNMLNSLIECYGCKNFITSITRPASNTIIDLAISYNDNDRVDVLSGTVAFGCSDHLPIFTILGHVKMKYKKHKLKTRVFNNASKLRYIEAIAAVDWQSICAAQSVNDMYNNFSCILETTYNTFFPLRTVKPKSIKSRKPYITTEIISLMTLRNR